MDAVWEFWFFCVAAESALTRLASGLEFVQIIVEWNLINSKVLCTVIFMYASAKSGSGLNLRTSR